MPSNEPRQAGGRGRRRGVIGVGPVSVSITDDDAGAALATVSEALRSGRRVHQLSRAFRDETTERDVDPMRLVSIESRWYLEGWCHRAEAVRLFRVERIVAATVLDAASAIPEQVVGRDLTAGLFVPDPTDLDVVIETGPMPPGSLSTTRRRASPSSRVASVGSSCAPATPAGSPAWYGASAVRPGWSSPTTWPGACATVPARRWRHTTLSGSRRSLRPCASCSGQCGSCCPSARPVPVAPGASPRAGGCRRPGGRGPDQAADALEAMAEPQRSPPGCRGAGGLRVPLGSCERPTPAGWPAAATRGPFGATTACRDGFFRAMPRGTLQACPLDPAPKDSPHEARPRWIAILALVAILLLGGRRCPTWRAASAADAGLRPRSTR